MGLLKFIFGVEEKEFPKERKIKKILLVRQHNQLGDMITIIPLFRGLTETFQGCEITLIASPQNINGIKKNPYLREVFSFDKSKLFKTGYISKLKKILRVDYDLIIVPTTVSISFTSNLIARLANGKFRIGPASLNGEINKESCFFDMRVNLDWRRTPDVSSYEKSLEIVKGIGVKVSNYKGVITVEAGDIRYAEDFIKQTGKKEGELLIGMHPGAGKPQNRWSADNFVELIKRVRQKYNAVIYLTGGGSDKEILDYINTKSEKPAELYYNTTIAEIAALAGKSDLFISTDTGIMHVAGATDVPLIAIFGPTSPFNWAPMREGVHFLRKSDFIDDVSVSEVFDVVEQVLREKRKEEK